MNLQKLKDILNSESNDSQKESLVIKELAKDENAMNIIMKILAEERTSKKELINELNLELSRAHIYIETSPEVKPEAKSKSKQLFDKKFVIDKITEFYTKNKGVIQHCFNKFN